MLNKGDLGLVLTKITATIYWKSTVNQSLHLYHLLIFTKVSARKVLSFPFHSRGNWGLYCQKVLEPGVKPSFVWPQNLFLPRSRAKFLLRIIPNTDLFARDKLPLVEVRGTPSMPLYETEAFFLVSRESPQSYFLLFFFFVIIRSLARDPKFASSIWDALCFSVLLIINKNSWQNKQ